MSEIDAIRLSSDETLLRVTGYGESIVSPDILTIFIAVRTVDENIGQAMETNANTMDRIINALHRAGVTKEDTQTNQIRVTPQIGRHGAGDIVAFEVRNSLMVRLRDFSAAREIIAMAFDSGANDVQGPVFDTNDRSAGLAEAQIAALADARVKAEAYATGLGLRLARVLMVSEGVQTNARVVFSNGRTGGGSGPPVEEGVLRRSMSVSLSYALVRD